MDETNVPDHCRRCTIFGRAAGTLTRASALSRSINPMGRSSSRFHIKAARLEATPGPPPDRASYRSGRRRGLPVAGGRHGVLYTPCTQAAEEVVLAADAETGRRCRNTPAAIPFRTMQDQIGNSPYHNACTSSSQRRIRARHRRQPPVPRRRPASCCGHSSPVDHRAARVSCTATR